MASFVKRQSLPVSDFFRYFSTIPTEMRRKALTHKEISITAAKTLYGSLPTDERLWTFARAWLRARVPGAGWDDNPS